MTVSRSLPRAPVRAGVPPPGAWTWTFAALVFALAAMFAPDAVAQTISIGTGGSSSGLGYFSSMWSFFQNNFAEGIILCGVAALGITLMMLRFHLVMVAQICAGAVIVANAVAIAAGVVTLGGGGTG